MSARPAPTIDTAATRRSSPHRGRSHTRRRIASRAPSLSVRRSRIGPAAKRPRRARPAAPPRRRRRCRPRSTTIANQTPRSSPIHRSRPRVRPPRPAIKTHPTTMSTSGLPRPTRTSRSSIAIRRAIGRHRHLGRRVARPSVAPARHPRRALVRQFGVRRRRISWPAARRVEGSPEARPIDWRVDRRRRRRACGARHPRPRRRHQMRSRVWSGRRD